MVQGLANLVELFVLLPILLDILLLGEALLCQLSYLDLVVGSVKKLTFALLQPYPQHLYFLRKALDLNGLENNNELNVIAKVCFAIVREVLNAGSGWRKVYFLRSSP